MILSVEGQEGSDEFGDVYCRNKFFKKSVSQNKLSSPVQDGVSQGVYHGVSSYLRSIKTETRQNLICIGKVIYKCILIPVFFFLLSRSPGAVMTVGYQDAGGDGQGLT